MAAAEKPSEKVALKLSSIQVFETLVIPGISTNVNKIVVAGEATIPGTKKVDLELTSNMVIVTLTPSRSAKVVVVGIPLTFVKTLVFA